MSTSDPTARPGLSISGLNISFRNKDGWTSVVRNLGFDIAPGETVAIVGESGSGKSVTALSVLGLLPQQSTRIEGSIRLGDRELLSLSPKDLKALRGNAIAMIFQEPMTSLNPTMCIGEQIAESIIAHRGTSTAEAKAEAIRLMEKVHIPSAARRYGEYPHQFSGGMRQRVMIAIALACKPALLIADEPTTALDVTIQAQVLNLIKELQEEEGMAVLFITHDMGVVAEVADRMVVMYRGDVVEEGATTEIFANSRHPYTKALLSAVPQLGSMSGSNDPQPFDIYDINTGLADEASVLKSTVDMSQILLDVKDLTVRFPVQQTIFGKVTARVHAVENVSLTLARGETLAIVGESGSGKSTTGKLITGLLHPTAGTVEICGKPMRKDTRQSLSRSVQMIFQDPFSSLNPRLTVGRAITEPLRIHKIATEKERDDIAASLLTRVGLSPEIARRYPHEFSGGQRQRICVARTLALKPSVIIADEAVSALDVSVKAQVVNLLLELQQEMQLGFIFISHDMAVVERISHRVAVMYLGEIVEIGPRAAIFSNPVHPYTRRLIEAVPVPDPSRRLDRHKISDSEIRSAVRPGDYVPPARTYREVSPGHLVQDADPEWAA
ncbi:ABC transporter ATP-binding protein [Neorhizobium sp. JUb45]|uniref:ABC transporter ATP-binding protein n=1 Tax=Neorhizobium sp. JUb45 TaxID=2485113 RepID=UPI0010485B15|nr:ABC transporter ATP-binding protein [Neorhizobium sp. JUb45]TCQ96733.1 peptide/nickel transport system ATP-binding protein [Neorhizobium sp. JUb45]